LRLRVDATSVGITSEGAALSVCGGTLRLPDRLAPRTVAHAWPAPDDPDGSFEVQVRVIVPVIGEVLSYRGRISEEDE
jgi:hypothetical protein